MDSHLLGNTLREKYRIVEPVRKKLWTNYYKAEKTDTKESFFIREIHEPFIVDAEQRSEYQKRVHSFMENLVSLEHPHIIKTLEHFREIDRYYIVCEYLHGISLNKLAVTWESTEEDIVRAALTVCRSLQYLSELHHPVILRCLSAEKIIVSQERGAILVDLGFKALFNPIDKNKVIIRPYGVPGYASPEEYGNGRLDVRADIYSFGALLYFLYTRQIPPESLDILMGNETLALPSRIRKNINPKIEQIILKCLSLDRKDRFESFLMIEKAINEATSKSWSAVHLHQIQRPPVKPRSDLTLEDIPSIEPFIPRQEWVIDKFKKNEIGLSSPVGLDVGSEYIKISALEKRREGTNVTLLARIPTPIGAFSHGVIKEPVDLARYIREWLEDRDFYTMPPARQGQGFLEKLAASAGLARKSCVVMVGGPELYVRSFDTESNNQADIRYQAMLQLRDGVPFRAEDARIEMVTLEKEKKSRILVFAISKTTFDQMRELAHNLNLSCVAVDFEPFALFRSLVMILGNDSLTGSVALLNIGADYSSINFFRKGTIRHCRLLPFGGNTINSIISKSLDISFNRVERLKREYAILPQDGVRDFLSPFTESLFKLIEPQMKDFVKELKKTFNYFSTVQEDKKVELLFITGGGALLKGLDRYIKNQLGTSVIVGNALRNMTWNNILEGDIEKLDDDYTHFTTSLGLAGYEIISRQGVWSI